MDDLYNLVKNYSIHINILTFFIGLYVGNKLTLWRDKRKEFNELTKGIRLQLEQSIRSNYFIHKVNFDDKTLILSYFGNIKKYKLMRIIKQYEYYHNRKSKRDKLTGVPIYDKNCLETIGSISKSMVKYFQPR